MKCWSVFFAICLFSPLARADRASEARAHYESATSHFAVGEFAEAAAEYQAAFKLKADPALLYNAAQAYRLANNPEKAVILYKNYLQLYPNEPNAEEVRTQIAKLKDAIAAAEKAKTAPPTGMNEPKQLPAANAASSMAAEPGAPASAPVATTAVAPAKKDVPVYKKWWLWTIVGVVVAGGAVTGAVLATRNTSWSNAPDVGPGSRNAITVSW